ncbi:cytochrome P460 family protein [Klebsiella aerogenes]|uniref:cytochrome P460 family protein n=1 Tax=Klebsiella aerogenes TaxID=548 RepID=UPI0037B664C3
MKKHALALLILAAPVMTFPSLATDTKPQNNIPAPSAVVHATFEPDGSVKLPTDFHHWVHVGTFIKEQGINIFDNSKIVIPLIGNTYIEPGAFRYYMATGKWADGSQIVKEFTEAESGPECDTTTKQCRTELGEGIYQDRYAGFGYMIKDAKHFRKAAGNWGYFTSGHVTPPYPATAKAESVGKCAACHIAHASDQDFVFAAQKIGLERDNPDNQ